MIGSLDSRTDEAAVDLELQLAHTYPLDELLIKLLAVGFAMFFVAGMLVVNLNVHPLLAAAAAGWTVSFCASKLFPGMIAKLKDSVVAFVLSLGRGRSYGAFGDDTRRGKAAPPRAQMSKDEVVEEQLNLQREQYRRDKERGYQGETYVERNQKFLDFHGRASRLCSYMPISEAEAMLARTASDRKLSDDELELVHTSVSIRARQFEEEKQAQVPMEVQMEYQRRQAERNAARPFSLLSAMKKFLWGEDKSQPRCSYTTAALPEQPTLPPPLQKIPPLDTIEYDYASSSTPCALKLSTLHLAGYRRAFYSWLNTAVLGPLCKVSAQLEDISRMHPEQLGRHVERMPYEYSAYFTHTDWSTNTLARAVQLLSQSQHAEGFGDQQGRIVLHLLRTYFDLALYPMRNAFSTEYLVENTAGLPRDHCAVVVRRARPLHLEVYACGHTLPVERGPNNLADAFLYFARAIQLFDSGKAFRNTNLGGKFVRCFAFKTRGGPIKW